LQPLFDQIEFVTMPGIMGADSLREFNAGAEIVGTTSDHTTARDTMQGAAAIIDTKVDLLIFVGGDGTARDVLSAIGHRQLVLGLPAGVKMHSVVFGIDPFATAE